MADTPLCTVDFHGTSLVAVVIDGKPYVALRPICDALTIDFQAQQRRIHRNPVMAEGVAITATPSPGGPQQTLCLPLDLLNGWLFGISAARVRDPARRERLVQYQRECFAVLEAHFNRATPEPQPAHSLPTPLSLTEWRLRYDYEGQPQFTQLERRSICGTVEQIAHAIRDGGWTFADVRTIMEACHTSIQNVASRISRGISADEAEKKRDLILAAAALGATASEAGRQAGVSESYGRRVVRMKG